MSADFIPLTYITCCQVGYLFSPTLATVMPIVLPDDTANRFRIVFQRHKSRKSYFTGTISIVVVLHVPIVYILPSSGSRNVHSPAMW